MTDTARKTLGRLPAAAFGRLTLPPIPSDILDGFRALPDLTGMVSDAMDLAGLSGAVAGSELRPTLAGRRVVGPVITVLNRARGDTPAEAVAAADNRLADIEAHNLARPGDVTVIQGVDGVSSLGGIAAAIARRQGEAAIIVDGAVRDVEASRERDLPVWARGVTPVTGKWRIETVAINVAVTICGVTVHPGDLVVADDTGICFVPHAALADILTRARAIAADERRRQEMIANGRTLHELAARPGIKPQTDQPK
ncbi:RraA family protein [Nitratireductor soli]|uniref:RraA family protein n=1 Tax=Nitratireductor soli TaxID=1670619 RepID=UPI00069D4BE8|nr:RraA family protein [Nitratireductor soli]